MLIDKIFLRLQYRLSMFSFPRPQAGLIFSVFLGSLLFLQLPLSFIAFEMGLPNRSLMLSVRAFTMLASIFIVATCRPFRLKPWLVAIFFFWGFYVIRLLLDIGFLGVHLLVPAWELLAWGIGSSLLPALAVYSISARTDSSLNPLGLIGMGVASLAFSLCSFLLNYNPFSMRFMLHDLNPITTGHAGASLFLISVASLCCPSAGKQSPQRSWLVYSGILLGILITIYSATRSAFATALLGLIFASFFAFGAKSGKIILLITSLVSGLLLLASRNLGVDDGLVHRLYTFGQDSSELDRIKFIVNGFKYWLEQPLLGVGFRTHQLMNDLIPDLPRYYPHNFLIESLMLGGLVLGGLFLLFVIITALTAFRLLEVSPSDLWVVLLWLQSFVYVMVSGHLGNVPFFWFSSAVICGRYEALLVREVRPR